MSIITSHHRPLAADLVLSIAVGLARAEPLWSDRVRHDGEERDAVRLLAHDRYEAWVIGWPPDHRTTMHDHGVSIGALVVVEGELLERRPGRAGGADVRMRPGRAMSLPSGLVHDVRSPAQQTATSIHVYSPPLASMTFYDERSGVPERVLRIADDAAVLDAADLATALHPAGTARG